VKEDEESVNVPLSALPRFKFCSFTCHVPSTQNKRRSKTGKDVGIGLDGADGSEGGGGQREGVMDGGGERKEIDC
jgi:hypothetical protein